MEKSLRAEARRKKWTEITGWLLRNAYHLKRPRNKCGIPPGFAPLWIVSTSTGYGLRSCVLLVVLRCCWSCRDLEWCPRGHGNIGWTGTPVESEAPDPVHRLGLPRREPLRGEQNQTPWHPLQLKLQGRMTSRSRNGFMVYKQLSYVLRCARMVVCR